MAVADLQIRQEELADFCRSQGIHKLSLFGSVLSDRFSDSSDVDILIEFESGQRVGYLRMAALERELSALFGRKVDLRTQDELSRYFRDEVAKVAVVQYVNE